MNCRECQSKIDLYVNERLNQAETDEFYRHVRGCSECMEELKVNYSILTALKQLDNGEELSEDYDRELDDKISSYFFRKRHKAIVKRISFVAIFLVSLVLGIIIAMFTVKSENVNYGSKELADTAFVLNYDGVPESISPVRKAVNEYNDRIINYLHEKSEK